MPKALFILEDIIRQKVYPSSVYDQISGLVDVYAPPQTPATIQDNPSILNNIELLFSSWSCPTVDAELLRHAPNLKIVFYGAGSIKRVVSDTFWECGLRITHSADANAITVAQFTLGQIVLSLKGMWQHMVNVKRERTFVRDDVYPGLYQSTVGIIGLGMIGRHVCEFLQAFDTKIIAFDPFTTEKTAAQLGVTLVDLETLFRSANVVSLHAPWLPETEGMINGEHIKSMQPYSTFINTARGALVREDELIEALRNRPDIYALLDVTYPEPPSTDSAFYDLPNAILTPHVAGAVDANDTRRLGDMMLGELRRYLETGNLHWEVTQDRLKTMA